MCSYQNVVAPYLAQEVTIGCNISGFLPGVALIAFQLTNRCFSLLTTLLATIGLGAPAILKEKREQTLSRNSNHQSAGVVARPLRCSLILSSVTRLHTYNRTEARWFNPPCARYGLTTIGLQLNGSTYERLVSMLQSPNDINDAQCLLLRPRRSYIALAAVQLPDGVVGRRLKLLAG